MNRLRATFIRRPAFAAAALVASFSAGLALAATPAARPAPAAPAAVAPAKALLPDLGRGQLAAREGRLDAAEADLRPLAERGYLDAQIALGRLYARMGAPDRVELAIGWLRVAHQRAPDQVAVPLGRLLQKQGKPESLDEVRALLGSAYARNGDVDALSGLIRLFTDYPERDVDQRAPALVAKAEKLRDPEPLSAAVNWYRKAPDVAERNRKLIALCQSALEQVPECYVDLTQVARLGNDKNKLKKLSDGAIAAYGQQRLAPAMLAAMARAMVDVPDENGAEGWGATSPAAARTAAAAPLPLRVSDIPDDEHAADLQAMDTSGAGRACGSDAPLATPAAAGNAAGASAKPASSAEAQPELANELLVRLAKGPADAQVYAAGVVARYPYLQPAMDVEQALKAGVAQNIGEARLYLGQLYLQGARVRRDPDAALQQLQAALDNPLTALQAHYFVGRLYLYGYLDEAQPLVAAQHLLWAARRGYPPADTALARLFSGGKGVCPNLKNAYVFAQLGARGGNASAADLAARIAAQLSAEQKTEAVALLESESRARPSEYEIPATLTATRPPRASTDPHNNDAAGKATADRAPPPRQNGDAS